MVRTGAELSRRNVLELLPWLPTASVCETVTAFAPSPAEKRMAAEKVELLQVVVEDWETPVPLILTVSPDSQLPEIVKPSLPGVLAAGFKMLMPGVVESLIKVRLSMAVVPFESACETVTVLVPSTADNIIFCEKTELLQATLVAAVMFPEIVTLTPD